MSLPRSLHHHDQPRRPSPWLSLQQTCEELQISRWTLRRLTISGELKPGVHFRYLVTTPGGRHRHTQFHREELEKQLARISMKHHRLRLQRLAEQQHQAQPASNSSDGQPPQPV